MKKLLALGLLIGIVLSCLSLIMAPHSDIVAERDYGRSFVYYERFDNTKTFICQGTNSELNLTNCQPETNSLSYKALALDLGISFLAGFVIAFSMLQYLSEKNIGILGSRKRKIIILSYILFLLVMWGWYLYVQNT